MKSIKLNKKPIELPSGIEEGIETAEWVNVIIDQIFYAAGGLTLVELLHTAFVSAMEQRSSIISNSDLRVLIGGLAVKEFRLGKHLPRFKYIQTKSIGGSDFALVYDVEFVKGNTVMELGAKMGLGLKDVIAKMVATRFVGKSVIKFEMSPNPRVSLLITSLPEYRLLITYGKKPMVRLSSLIELVIQGVFKSKLLYPQYMTFILNLNAENSKSLAFVSPANTIQSILRLGNVKASIKQEILAECNALKISIHIGTQKFKSATMASPFLSNKLSWKLGHTFNLLPESEDAVDISIRLVNRKKILGTEILGGLTISLSSIPIDSHETLKIELREGIELEVEVFHARIAESGFVDREWIFWNEAPPVPVKEDYEDADTEPTLDRINISTVAYALQKLLSGAPPSDFVDENQNELLCIEEFATEDENKIDIEVERRTMDAVEVFYHSAVSYLKGKPSMGRSKSLDLERNLETVTRQASLPDMKSVSQPHKFLLLILLSHVSYDSLHTVIYYNQKTFEDLLHHIDDSFLYFALSHLLHLKPQQTNGNSRILCKPHDLLSNVPLSSCFLLRDAIVDINQSSISISQIQHLSHCRCFGTFNGKQVRIEAFSGFISWFSLKESLFPLNILDLKRIEQVVYCYSANPYFCSGDQEVTKVSESLRLVIDEQDFIFEGEDLFELYFYIQSHFFKNKSFNASMALLDCYQRLVINQEIIIRNCPLELVLQLPAREVMFEPQLFTIVMLNENRFGEEAEFQFEGSFMYRGLIRGLFTIKRDVLIFEGIQNRYKALSMIIPSRSISSVASSSRMFLGGGIEIQVSSSSSSTQDFSLELFVFSLSESRADISQRLSNLMRQHGKPY